MPSLVTSGAGNSRQQIDLTARGLIAETFHIAVCGNAELFVTQALDCVAIPLKAGDVISNIVTFVNTAGASLTLAQYALYKKDGTLLANSANSTGSFGSGGVYVPLALTSPYTVPADDNYYVGGLFVGTTPPTLLRGSGLTGVAAAVNSGMKFAVQQAGQTSLPATATFVAFPRGTYWGVY